MIFCRFLAVGEAALAADLITTYQLPITVDVERSLVANSLALEQPPSQPPPLEDSFAKPVLAVILLPFWHCTDAGKCLFHYSARRLEMSGGKLVFPQSVFILEGF